MDTICGWCLLKGSGVVVVLEGPDDLLIEKSLNFEFKANNNQANYKSLIFGMVLSLEMGSSSLKSKSVLSLLPTQVVREYHMKEPQLIKYLKKVYEFYKCFKSFEIKYVPTW